LTLPERVTVKLTVPVLSGPPDSTTEGLLMLKLAGLGGVGAANAVEACAMQSSAAAPAAQ
jgi:hypothetical protein